MVPHDKKRKDRFTAATDEPVRTKTQDTTNEAFGFYESSVQARLDQDIALYQKGFQDGLREGLALGPNHPAVIESVKRMFPDWDGAENARQRSIQRFKHEQGDAA